MSTRRYTMQHPASLNSKQSCCCCCYYLVTLACVFSPRFMTTSSFFFWLSIKWLNCSLALFLGNNNQMAGTIHETIIQLQGINRISRGVQRLGSRGGYIRKEMFKVRARIRIIPPPIVDTRKGGLKCSKMGRPSVKTIGKQKRVKKGIDSSGIATHVQ